MGDITLQSQLDPTGQGRGIMIQRRVNYGTKTGYYCVPVVTNAGHARWVEVNAADTDNQKETAIRAALS
jgi:hypothetical protein